MLMKVHALKRLSEHGSFPTTLPMPIPAQSLPLADGMENPRHNFRNIKPMSVWCGGVIPKG